MWTRKDNKIMKEILIALTLIAPLGINEINYKIYTVSDEELPELIDAYFLGHEISIQDIEYRDALDLLDVIELMVLEYDRNSFALLKADIQHIINESRNNELITLMGNATQCNKNTLLSRIRQARKIIEMKDRNIRTEMTRWRSL